MFLARKKCATPVKRRRFQMRFLGLENGRFTRVLAGKPAAEIRVQNAGQNACEITNFSGFGEEIGYFHLYFAVVFSCHSGNAKK